MALVVQRVTTRHEVIMRTHAWQLLQSLLVIAALMPWLVGCGGGASAVIEIQDPAGGGITPESVVENFFEDLRSALQEPTLVDDTSRSYWVERLTRYFAPEERFAQRIALNASLTRFAADRAKLADDEALSLEMTFDRPIKLSDDGDRAMVQLPNASMLMMIIRNTDRGPVTLYEQPIELRQLIGNSAGLIPTIKLSDRWYLTEG